MTREEAIKRVKGYLTDCLPTDCYGEIEEIIEALEQEPILDKIRAEIKALTSNRGFLSCSVDSIHEEIDAVFDKYKAESEG